MHLADHAACRGLEQARNDRVHEGCESGAEQACRKAEREEKMLAVGLVDRLRMRQEQPVQDGRHGRTPAVGSGKFLSESGRADVPNVTAGEEIWLKMDDNS